MNNKNVKGTIFDTIEWVSQKQLNTLIDDMDDEQVRFLTIKALECGFSRASFSLVESEIVSKLIRKISYQEDGN
jgi:hypothetical protein